jgi:hypothetical protein
MPSAALTLRNTKGSALTFTEMDNNLTNLATAANASASLSGASFTGNVEMNNNHISNAILQVTVEKTANIGAITGAVTINGNTGPIQRATLVGNITINTTNLTNFSTGESVTLVLTQDATGSRLLTSNLRYAGGSKTLSTAANSIDTISIVYDGTNYLAALVKGYA